MPFGSRKFFSGKVRSGASSIPALLTISNATFETTAKYGSHSLLAGQVSGTPSSQNKITVYPKDRNFFLNSDHAWTIEWWVRTTDDNFNDIGNEIRLARIGSDLANNYPDRHKPRFTMIDPGDPEAWRCIGASGFEDGRRELNATEWVHFAMVSRGTDSTVGQLEWFINGVEQDPSVGYTQDYNDISWNATNRDFAFGFYDTQSVPNFSGGVYWDEIRISNVVRYTTNFTPPTSAFTGDENTLALFHLNNNFADASV